MQSGKRAKVLFFTKDAVMTDDEREAAEDITGAHVQYRNGAAVEGSIEATDFVAGTVPKSYAHYDTYSRTAVKAFDKARHKQATLEQNAAPRPMKDMGGGPPTESPTPQSPLAGGSAEAAAGLAVAPSGARKAKDEGEVLGSSQDASQLDLGDGSVDGKAGDGRGLPEAQPAPTPNPGAAWGQS